MRRGEVTSKIKAYRSEYENFKPLLLPKMTEKTQHSLSKSNKAEESSLYETLPVGGLDQMSNGLDQMSNGAQKSVDKTHMQNDKQWINKPKDVKIASPCQQHLYNKYFEAEVTECTENGLNKIIRGSETSKKPLAKPTHPIQHADADALLLPSYGLQNEHATSSKTVAGTPALVKQRISICRQPDTGINNIDTDFLSNVYENTMKGGEVEMHRANNTSSQVAVSKGNDKRQCSAMQRKEMTYLHSSGENREIVHDVDDSSLVYENIPMQMPTNVEKDMTKSHTFHTMTKRTDDHAQHDAMVPNPLSPLGRDGTNFAFSTNKQNDTKQNSQHTVTQKADKIQLVLPATKKPPVSAKPTIVSLQTKLPAQVENKNTHKAKKDLPYDAIKEPEVDNDITASTILLDYDDKILSEKSTKANPKSNLIQSTQFSLQQQGQVFKAKQINVKQLKVNDLGVWMAEKLRLGKYVSHFAEEMIDGALLVDLEEDMLITSFGFSVLEAKRLRKFATEGHVPT
ncbi:hypothetical protein CHS0354_000174 [Potamilus streckersoni]|uniref:SAM domain-containing protein n=1 Tax=Potamilus streckersoni TaxID=2493646 RepID=A0AAE0RM07_9BIVA|nr:hypothetical protein CHS0354_000174 [Potamilus streckersoni]